MRRFIIVMMVFSFLVLSAVQKLTAQIAVGVNVNVNPPYWAPQYSNVERVQYYYLPDIESYYDVYNREFVYFENGRWIFAPQLPPRFGYFDFENSFSVVLDYNVRNPWLNHRNYVQNYPRNYYQNLYRREGYDRDRYVRGYNENERREVYRNNYVREENRERREFAERRENKEHREQFNNNQRREQYREPQHTERREVAHSDRDDGRFRDNHENRGEERRRD